VTVVLESSVPGRTRAEAIDAFLNLVDRHRSRIEETEHLVQQVYRFQTPDRPILSFDVTGFSYQKSDWVHSSLDELLDANMQSIAFRLESLPASDYMPILSLPFPNDFIPLMFGAEFERVPYENWRGADTSILAGRTAQVIPKKAIIGGLDDDLSDLPDPDPLLTETGAQACATARFLVTETRRKLPIAWPQTTGPLAVAARLMDQEEMLIGCHADKEWMRILVERIWRVVIRLGRALENAIGDPLLLRPRPWRFLTPPWVRAVVADDWVSVVGPGDYYDVCSGAWQETHDALGDIFLHTCGPVSQCADTLARLPGLTGFEFAFANGFSKTTRELLQLKERFRGCRVLHPFALPDGQVVSDPQNLSAGWLEVMNRDGGFVLTAVGTPEVGRELFSCLGLSRSERKYG
jgi:hypothetical protein